MSLATAILIDRFAIIDFKKLFGNNAWDQVAIFSNTTLNHLIEEESKRDTSVIIEREAQSLRSMSSGERKIAFLKYLLSLEPLILIVDNFYENLDPINRSFFHELLLEYSKSNRVIQVVRNEKELFPFISNLFVVENDALVAFSNSIESFFKSPLNIDANFSIPKSIDSYQNHYKTFVKLKDVSVKFFDNPILNKINWEIELGDFWQLIGENGSGKTTLLSLITGDSHKAYGQNIVLFDKLKGTEENVWEIKQKIGYFTPTITELFNRRHSVLDMVLSGFYDSIGLYIKPLDTHIRLAYKWLALLQMSDQANKTFTRLPLIQQRMVLIARAMVKHPPLLILDEPTSGLDRGSKKLIVSLINKIAKESKITIIYVSHVMEEGLTPNKTYKLSKDQLGSIGIEV